MALTRNLPYLTPDMSPKTSSDGSRQIRRIAVIGAGAWGTALAMAFARTGKIVYLWGRDETQMRRLATQRENAKYLPGISFPASLRPTAKLEDAVTGADAVFVVVPSSAFKANCRNIAQYVSPGCPVISCAKGLDPDTNGLLTTRIKSEIPQSIPMVLSGPSFASEVANEEPTSVVLAGNPVMARALSDALCTSNFQLITEPDLVGAQVGGIMKNVIAIACGMADGLGHGSNTRASILARGLDEAGRLAAALGGNPMTLLGVAGAGDLALTCTDAQSRNYSFGRALADPSVDLGGKTFEGAASVSRVCALMASLQLETEIAEAVCRTLNGDLSPRDLISALFAADEETATDLAEDLTA